MDKKELELIKNTTEDFLKKLLITGEIKIVEDDGAVKVTIETAEPGILIGHHGRSLEAIQILLGQIVYKQTGVWNRIIVSVGDYRDRRAKQLQEMALSLAEKTVQTQEPVILRDLTPADRRTIHLTLSSHTKVTSASEGEGRNRCLIIKPKP